MLGAFFGLDALTVVPGPERARLLASGSYHFPNRVDHKVKILSLDVVAAVRVRYVLGVDMRGELVLSRQPCRACLPGIKAGKSKPARIRAEKKKLIAEG